MATETETKYEPGDGASLPDLVSLSKVRSTRGPDREQLEAQYYDTADLRLLRSGITLRRRKGGHDAGWHLKLPAGPDTRQEIRLPLSRGGRRVPAELASLVKARSRGERLVPVATIATLRETITLLDGDGESLAEVADDHVHATATVGEFAEPAEWREIEVELTGGGRDLLDEVDNLLRRAGMRRSGRSAKLEQVLGSQLAERPAPPGVDATAVDVVAGYLREHADSLMALDPMVRRREQDAVHKMRVATRRLRSTLRSFGTVAATADSQHLAKELKWLGMVLGEEHDAEVQAGRLREQVRATGTDVLLGPVQARIEGHVAKAAATSHAAVTAALNSGRYYALLDDLKAFIFRPGAGPDAGRRASVILPTAVGRSYRKTRRRMDAAIQEPPGPSRDAALHSARKAAKRTRYAAEASIPIGGKQAQRLAGQMKRLQSVLGDHHDTVVGRQVSRMLGIAAQLAGEEAFTYGLFYERDSCRAEGLDGQVRKTWQRARKRKYRFWST